MKYFEKQNARVNEVKAFLKSNKIKKYISSSHKLKLSDCQRLHATQFAKNNLIENHAAFSKKGNAD